MRKYKTALISLLILLLSASVSFSANARSLDLGNVLDVAQVALLYKFNGGSLLDTQGQVIAHVDRNGRIQNAGKATIGYITKDGDLQDSGRRIVGYVTPEGNIYDAAKQRLANISATGKVVDPYGKLYGQISPEGWVKGYGDISLGMIKWNMPSEERLVVAKYGTPKAELRVDANAGKKILTAVNNLSLTDLLIFAEIYYVRHSRGVLIRRGDDRTVLFEVDSLGGITDVSGKALGRITDTGLLYDASNKLLAEFDWRSGIIRNGKGKLLGTMERRGLVRDADGAIIGEIDHDGYVYTTNKKLAYYWTVNR